MFMSRIIALLTFTAFNLSQANYAYAEWFFRGTSSQWNAIPMQMISVNEYQTCQSFGTGDNSGGPRFKVDRFGDWDESYPSSDVAVNDNSSYQIVFDTATKNIDTTDIDSCETTSEYEKNFNSLYFRGTLNNWGLTDMRLVGDNLWRVTVSFSGNSQQRFKFDISGDWSQNYGDANADGVLEPGGSDIFSSLVGEHQIEVNDNTLRYSILPVDGSTNDSWFFRGTPNNWSTTEMETEDSINFCIEQQFGNNSGGNAPRFKIDHFGDWTENYPEQDFVVEPNNSYKICFNSNTKAIVANPIDGIDNEPPTVAATPPGGSYSEQQDITLSIIDNQDNSPQLFYTLDNSEPTTTSMSYSGETITAVDQSDGVDRVIRTLAIDSAGNESQQSFSYIIGTPSNEVSDFRQETIYFVLTARFYDGDSGNNYYNRDRIKAGDPHWRGDFKGLIEQLDYIQDLGFTAIWITPPVENRSGLDYHGYHAYDWNRVDPRLESVNTTYQDFINAAHARGLKVIQDVVINHSGQYGIRGEVWIDHLPIKYYVPEGAIQGEVSNDPYFGNLGDYESINRDDNDNPVAPQWFVERHNSDPEGIVPLVDPKTGETVPKPGYDPNRFFGVDAGTLDSQWYHQEGFIAGGDWENPEASQTKHLAGDTMDLATENQNVKDYLNSAIKGYLDMGVDAIRLDTAKHVERNELLSYTQDWQSHKPELFVFGEVLVKGLGFGSELVNDNAPAAIRPWWYTRTGADPSNPQGNSNLSVLDFPLFSTFRDNVTRGSLSGIKGVLDLDWTYADSTQLVTFFQNHDVGPDNDFKYRYCCDQANAALAYNLLWTIRGIPSLYYGEEIMFMAGAAQDIQSSEDTVDQTGRAYFGPHLDDLATTQSHPLYQHIKRLNLIRQALPALQKGSMSLINEWGAGMSFVREYETSYVVVGLATGTAQNITLSGVKNGTYRDSITGNEIIVTNGNISFSVKSNSLGIYVLNGPGKIGKSGLYLN